jgi:hypothetical protein
MSRLSCSLNFLLMRKVESIIYVLGLSQRLLDIIVESTRLTVSFYPASLKKG